MQVQSHIRRAATIWAAVVVVGVIGVTATGSLWAWSRHREDLRAQVCGSILQRYGEAFLNYASDFGGMLPYENVGREQAGRRVWYDALENYMDAGERMCPTVDRSAENHKEGYRINSKLSNSRQPYRALDSLENPGQTVLLFDGEYGGVKFSLKGQLKDAQFRHNGSLNLLFVDGTVQSFTEAELTEATNWLPPKVIWDPGANPPPTGDE